MSSISDSELADCFGGRISPLILEVGANDGTDTARFIRLFRESRVHAFECDPRAIARWHARKLSASLHEIALGDSAGIRDFHPSGGIPSRSWKEYGDWDKSGSLLPFDNHDRQHPWMKRRPVIQVQSLTLDEWADEYLAAREVIDLAWIDVQGAEALVLKGAVRTIRSIRYLYCEYEEPGGYKGQATYGDLARLLPGFELIRAWKKDLLFRNSWVSPS